MADPVATVEKIIKIGLKIKDAVDTVRYNVEECKEIKKRVLRFSAILSQLQQTGMMDGSPALSGALEDLEESLQHALELVTACQVTSTLRRLITAGDLSKKLHRVKEDILNKVMLASFAINAHTTVVLLTIQAGGHPHRPPRQPQDAAVEISHGSQSIDDARSELNDVETNLLAGSEASVAPLLHAIRKFKGSVLKAATNGFSKDNKIGQGGCFEVYKGVLKDGSIVAIKKAKSSDYPKWQEDCYDNLLAASKLQHKNIVKFLGYSHEAMPISLVQLFNRTIGRATESGFIFVEEYVPNGSLDRIIYGPQDTRLDWSSLFRIIVGVAQGVQYLHEQRVVHMDLTPRNILSGGYMPPEYMEDGILSAKNDVFAFGTTLLLTVGSIRRCPDSPSSQQRHSMYDYVYGRWAWKAWEAGRIEEEFDLSLFDGSQLMEMKRCVEIGLLCAQRDQEDRPTMADVLEMLHGHKELPVPKMPSWFREDSNSSPL